MQLALVPENASFGEFFQGYRMCRNSNRRLYGVGDSVGRNELQGGKDGVWGT